MKLHSRITTLLETSLSTELDRNRERLDGGYQQFFLVIFKLPIGLPIKFNIELLAYDSLKIVVNTIDGTALFIFGVNTQI